MGLFSSSKNNPPQTDIPADILADVNVNGEKKLSPPHISSSQSKGDGQNMGTSPFLKSRSAAQPTTPPLAEPVPGNLPIDQGEASKASGKDGSTPKSFHFSDQAPLPGEIHFTDVPASQPEPKVSTASQAALPSTNRPDFSQITQDKALTEKQREHLKPLKVSSPPQEKEKKGLWSSSNLLSLVVFLLILVFISGGSWYYLNTRSSQEAPSPDMSIGEMGQLPPIGELPKPEAGALLTDQPNYLKLDIETANLGEIQTLLAAEGQKMMNQNISTPVEYLVVDTNSNPVAFSRFAFLISADNPNTLVEASLEPFSLYLVLDNKEVRYALAVPLKQEIGTNFPTDKTVLPESLKKFFYPEPYSANTYSNVTFKQSNYKGNVIAYTNIDESKNLSLDMTLQEGILTIANSKNAMRAVIDKRTVPAE